MHDQIINKYLPLFQKIESSIPHIYIGYDDDDNGNSYGEITLGKIGGRISYQQLPGCCGVVVLYDLHIPYNQQYRGLGELLLKIALEVVKEDYSAVIATDITEFSQKVLPRNGFTLSRSFKNRKTDNTVDIYELTF